MVLKLFPSSFKKKERQMTIIAEMIAKLQPFERG